MSKFTFNSKESKEGAIFESVNSCVPKDIVWHVESSDGVCCTDCGKEFTEEGGFSARPFQGKLFHLLSHYRQTNCKNSPTRPKELNTNQTNTEVYQ